MNHAYYIPPDSDCQSLFIDVVYISSSGPSRVVQPSLLQYCLKAFRKLYLSPPHRSDLLVMALSTQVQRWTAFAGGWVIIAIHRDIALTNAQHFIVISQGLKLCNEQVCVGQYGPMWDCSSLKFAAQSIAWTTSRFWHTWLSAKTPYFNLSAPTPCSPLPTSPPTLLHSCSPHPSEHRVPAWLSSQYHL